MPSANLDTDLFGNAFFPPGFKYRLAFISQEEEHNLLVVARVRISRFYGKTPCASFGWRYDFNGGGLTKTGDVPEFLNFLRLRAESFATVAPGSLQQVLITEYGPGAAIGWHKDRSVFGEVVGISLLSPCTFRLRQKSGDRWERYNLTAEPRSVYLLRGPARTAWEHSIPVVEKLRSVTFRNVIEKKRPDLS